MDHPFLVAVARGLLERGVATFRYNFPYMEGRGWPPDRAPVLVETVRTAVAEAAARLPGVPLFVGGRSLGGRMTSTAAAEGSGLPRVRGLVLLAFPLHPRGKPATERAEHLAEVACPILVVQGSRDDRGDPTRLRQTLDAVHRNATIHVVEGGDHGFQVRKRSGRTEADVQEEVAGAVAGWLLERLG
jgi:predicted alpha/beta-hydrolase family hydrolase